MNVKVRWNMKREEILALHTNKIWLGSDSYWRTYIDDGKGRKLVKKVKREGIDDAIVLNYKKKNKKEKTTFDDCYWHWRSVQDKMVSDNTSYKYDTDYKRFFSDTKFANKDIKKITEEDIKVFIVDLVKNKKLCKRACKRLYWYINSVFLSAQINRLIENDPVKFLKAKQFYKYCTEPKKDINRVLVSDEDMSLLYKRFDKDHILKKNYITTYAVQFASLTGMRVGEIAALRWDCIFDDYILIDKSEKHNRKTNKYSIEQTKNKKERKFPLTDEIRDLLAEIYVRETEYGYLCEWVFANESGRIHCLQISSCAQAKCRQIGIAKKGIHAYRRTLNSKMKCAGVPTTVAAAILGHTEEVNEEYYTFDVTTMEEKQKIISEINKNTISENKNE
jgi:integrase